MADEDEPATTLGDQRRRINEEKEAAAKAERDRLAALEKAKTP